MNFSGYQMLSLMGGPVGVICALNIGLIGGPGGVICVPGGPGVDLIGGPGGVSPGCFWVGPGGDVWVLGGLSEKGQVGGQDRWSS